MGRGWLVGQYVGWTAVAFVGVALCWQSHVMAPQSQAHLPLRAVKVAMSGEARDQYLSKVEAFADANGMIMRVSRTSPDPNDVVMHMERADAFIIAVLASPLGGANPTYEVFIYANREPPPPSATLDRLEQGIEHVLGQVDGAVVSRATVGR